MIVIVHLTREKRHVRLYPNENRRAVASAAKVRRRDRRLADSRDPRHPLLRNAYLDDGDDRVRELPKSRWLVPPCGKGRTPPRSATGRAPD